MRHNQNATVDYAKLENAGLKFSTIVCEIKMREKQVT